jgi:hypothetical protein
MEDNLKKSKKDKNIICEFCGRKYSTKTGLIYHQTRCKSKLNNESKNELNNESNNEINIPVWKSEYLNSDEDLTNPLIILYGKRRSGKTTLLENLLKQIYNKYDLVIGITNTPSSKSIFEKYMSAKCIYPGLDDKKSRRMLKLIIDHQIKNNTNKILLIMDDIIDVENKQHNTKTINYISVNGRHLNMSVIITTQHTSSIEPIVRKNADLAFIFYSIDRDVKDIYLKHYFSDLKYDEFNDLMNKYCQNHSVLVSYTNRINDRIYHYNAMDDN